MPSSLSRPRSPQGPRPGPNLTREDELFVAMDGRVIRSGGREWQIEIVGIHCEDPSCWVQMAAVHADERIETTIHLAVARPGDLLLEVKRWLSAHGHRAR